MPYRFVLSPDGMSPSGFESPPPRRMRICGPPGPAEAGPPKPILHARRVLRSTSALPRPELRVTPAGRSLLIVSPLSSRPVVMLYGSADCTRNDEPNDNRRPQIGMLKKPIAR